jgi:hydroxypyruvate isomerase
LNLVGIFIVYGATEFFYYIKRRQGTRFKYNAKFPADNPFAKIEDTLAFVSLINRKGLKINLDLYHVQIGEGNLIDWCRRCQPSIDEIQVADVPAAWNPAQARSIITALREL